jgi:hypothetical protein
VPSMLLRVCVPCARVRSGGDGIIEKPIEIFSVRCPARRLSGR